LEHVTVNLLLSQARPPSNREASPSFSVKVGSAQAVEQLGRGPPMPYDMMKKARDR
jgi:hypothetical protein